MSNCFVCKTGKLTTRGCHEYCDNCDHMRFVMTPDYLATAAQLVGALMSNVKVLNAEILPQIVEDMIVSHLPQLNLFMLTLASKESFLRQFTDLVVDNAIN